MSEAASGPVRFTGTSDEVIDWLRANGVERVRVEYVDYAGVARGKAMDVAHFERMMHHGVAFCATVLAFDIAGNVVPATDYGETIGYADFLARPDLSSLRILRHEPDTALVMGTLTWPDGRLVEGDPRNVLHRVAGRMEEMGYGARCAPEFEFFLLDGAHEMVDVGVQCYSMQKRTQFLAEEYSLLDAVAAHGELECSHYEYGPGQYEVSIRHQPVREMADNGHLFRATAKEAAMQMGNRVTFMAKPFDKMTGNSCHFHMSLVDKEGNNAFAAPDQPHHINDTCRHFMGGVLARLAELTAIFFPNSNSYRRLVPRPLCADLARLGRGQPHRGDPPHQRIPGRHAAGAARLRRRCERLPRACRLSRSRPRRHPQQDRPRPTGRRRPRRAGHAPAARRLGRGAREVRGVRLGEGLVR